MTTVVVRTLTAAAIGLTAGYASTSLTTFVSLIDADSEFILIEAVNGVVVAALVAGVMATVVIPGLPRPFTPWAAVVALATIAAIAAEAEPNAVSRWAIATSVGVLLACGVTRFGNFSERAVLTIGWAVAASAGAALNHLLEPTADFGWTAYGPGDEPTSIAQVITTFTLVTISLAGIIASHFLDTSAGGPGLELSGRSTAVALVLPVIAGVINRSASIDPMREWIWFACAVAISAAIGVAALTLPGGDGQALALGLAISAVAMTTPNNFDADSWVTLTAPAVALIAGAVIGFRRPTVFLTLVGFAALAIVSTFADVPHASTLASFVIGYALVSIAYASTPAAVAIALPAIPLLSLPFAVYWAGYEPIGSASSSESFSTTVPSKHAMAITGMCLIGVTVAIASWLRRRVDNR